MIVQGSIIIGNKGYKKGDYIPWHKVYPFFMIHMLMFGGSGFFMAYFNDGLIFLYLHGGFAILIYVLFYLTMFGKDEVKWMFINSAFGFAAIYTQIDWILGFFNKSASGFPIQVHLIPFLYFVLYTFLLRQAFLDLFCSREDKRKERIANFTYVAFSVSGYAALYFLEK